jgi:hypothetical protein
MTIMQNLQYTEHLAEPMAELVTVFAKEFDNDLLGEKVLGCVGAPSFGDHYLFRSGAAATSAKSWGPDLRIPN